MKIGKFYKYLGYSGTIEFSEEDGIWYGSLLNTRDLINDSGETIDELYEQFQDAVEDYLEFKMEIYLRK